MLKNFIFIFVPSFAKVVVFAFLAAYFLVEKHEYVETVPLENCADKVFSVRVAGFPWSFYTYADDGRNPFNAANLAFDILLIYFVACFLVSGWQAGHYVFHSGSAKSQLTFTGSLVVVGLVSFVLLRIFGEAWLNDAVQQQNPKWVSLLLLAGVPADAEIYNGKDFALKTAARIGNREVTQILLGARAQINRVDLKKQTALHEAVNYNRREMIDVFLRAGADVRKPDRDGKTPLHRACDAITAKMLLDAGAQPQLKDLAGTIPPTFAAAETKSHTPIGPSSRTRTPDLPPTSTEDPNKATPTKGLSPEPNQTIEDTEKALLKKTLGAVKRKLSCQTSVGGRYIHKGKALNFSTDAAGTLKVWQNSQGFLYADCKQTGFYHVIILGENGDQQVMINLSQGKDTAAPLLAQSKETAIIHFDKKSGNAELHWYFSSQPIPNLKQAANRNLLSKITQHSIEIQKVQAETTGN